MPGSDQAFDIFQTADSAASPDACTSESRSRATKLQRARKVVPAKQGKCKAGVKDVAGPGRVHRLHLERRGIVESVAVPGEDTVSAQCRRSQAAAKS